MKQIGWYDHSGGNKVKMPLWASLLVIVIILTILWFTSYDIKAVRCKDGTPAKIIIQAGHYTSRTIYECNDKK